LANDKILRSFSNQTITNILRSIGTLCYRDISVDKIIEDGARRVEVSKDILMLQTLAGTAINLGIKDFKDSDSLKLLEIFTQEYSKN
jgi:hypothetical protein